MLTIDAQVHVWEKNTPERPWLPGWEKYSESERPEFTIEQLLPEMDAAGVDAVVLVPSGRKLGYRLDRLIEAAGKLPERFSTMACLDVTDANYLKTAEALLDQPTVRGFRLAFIEPEPRVLFEQDRLADLFALLERRRARVMLHPFGAYGVLERVVRRYPDLPIAVCHFGLIRSEKVRPIVPRLAPLLALAKYPNVSVKASALTVQSNQGFPFRDVHEAIVRIIDGFGLERVFWGSDMTQLACSYSEAREFFMHLPFLSGSDLEMVMGKSIRKWLDWSEVRADLRTDLRT